MFVYKHTETIEIAYFLRQIQTLRVNNLRILIIMNANFQSIIVPSTNVTKGGPL